MKSPASSVPGLLAKTRFYQPHVFQGRFDMRPYFEGWYYKIVDRELGLSLCLIPGVALGGHGDDHAFIQYADNFTGTSGYARFDLSQVAFSSEQLHLELGPHQLSDTYVKIVKDAGLPLAVDLKIDTPLFYPVSLIHPGIMGPFRFFPAMECYHGVHLVYGQVSGTVEIGGKEMVLSKGEIYIEKDWGKSFPKEWIWIQGSGFKAEFDKGIETQGDQDLSVHLLLSVANIPWFGRSFNGHLGYLWLGEERIDFGTYCGSSVHIEAAERVDEAEEVNKEQPYIIVVNRGDYHIVITAYNVLPIPLIAPSSGKMVRHMLEDLQANIDLEVYKKGELFYSGKAQYAGLEHCGDYRLLSL